MNLINLVSNIFAPFAQLVDDVHTSTEEKQQIKNQSLAMQNEITAKLIDYEKQLLESQANIITAEASGESWLQRSWRPITMLTFLVLVVLDSFGWLANPLSSEAWVLLQIGLGGYVVSRGVEKSVTQIKKP